MGLPFVHEVFVFKWIMTFNVQMGQSNVIDFVMPCTVSQSIDEHTGKVSNRVAVNDGIAVNHTDSFLGSHGFWRASGISGLK